MPDDLDVRDVLETADGPVTIHRLTLLDEAGIADTSTLPYSIRVLLEAALRCRDGFAITDEHVLALARWSPDTAGVAEVPFKPARVLLQDFTGVPSIVDLAALRSALDRLGGNPERINPQVPVDLVIDHSVQIDSFGTVAALAINAKREFERNRERYEFLHWGQRAFSDFRVVPPASGIVHQVNLEHLACVVQVRETSAGVVAQPDSLVGTDSHTTMINGLGVLGWGVGGIEAEAVMLGQPVYMVLPEVVGLELTGALPEGATATDLVLRVTEMLRGHGVVGKFVEYWGEGVSRLSLPDRATLANMSPEYGATMGFFPVDEETLRYLRRTGRGHGLTDLVERYCRLQGLFRDADSPVPAYSTALSLDMGTVEPSIAGPRRPQDRIRLRDAKQHFHAAMRNLFGIEALAKAAVEAGADAGTDQAAEAGADPGTDQAADPGTDAGADPGTDQAADPGTDAGAGATVDAAPDAGANQPAGAGGPAARLERRVDGFASFGAPISFDGGEAAITHGAVVIASITSCTNTSNPSAMIGAGLLAKKAVERGLDVKPWVKTSLAPGSRVVTRYLTAAGLMPYLQALRFHVVGYGCTTCIGNSGPLPGHVARAVQDNDLVACAVLSGNRNFEGRINPSVKANYLASPPLVVAYALAGTLDIDMQAEPLGHDPNGTPVYLQDIWPSQREVADAIAAGLEPEMFELEYADVFEGHEAWSSIPSKKSVVFDWQADSTYVREPPFFLGITASDAPVVEPIRDARILALLGDSITTDHISPAGAIAADSPAGKYLLAHGIQPRDFNSYGSRRGNHEVMMRGTFANVRLRNHLVPGTEGGWTKHMPSGERQTIYEAAVRYQEEGVPLVVLAGREYGSGSSRDWAAKGVQMLGVRAVMAESFERIHRANLIGMGVLPLQFCAGEGWRQLGLTGEETLDVQLPAVLEVGQTIDVRVTGPDSGVRQFETVSRLDSPVEVRYFQNGGILHTVLRDMLAGRN